MEESGRHLSPTVLEVFIPLLIRQAGGSGEMEEATHCYGTEMKHMP